MHLIVLLLFFFLNLSEAPFRLIAVIHTSFHLSLSLSVHCYFPVVFNSYSVVRSFKTLSDHRRLSLPNGLIPYGFQLTTSLAIVLDLASLVFQLYNYLNYIWLLYIILCYIIRRYSVQVDYFIVITWFSR